MVFNIFHWVFNTNFWKDQKETEKSVFFREKFVENMGGRVEKLSLWGKCVEIGSLPSKVMTVRKAKRRLWR